MRVIYFFIAGCAFTKAIELFGKNNDGFAALHILVCVSSIILAFINTDQPAESKE